MTAKKSWINRGVQRAAGCLTAHPWLTLVPLALGVLAGLAAAASFLSAPAAPPDTAPLAPAIEAAATLTPSLTPFQPGLPTPTPLPTLTSTPVPSTSTAAPVKQAVRPAGPPGLNLWGIDFGNFDQRVTIQITPPDASVNRGKSILISFLPGKTCAFGDQRACVNAFRTEGGGNLVFLSVHSGVGGQGQAYRNALEGTGIDSAGYTLKQIQANLRALEGAAVTITQGKTVVGGLVLAINGRVPASRLESYFSAPMEQALAKAASFDPVLQPAVQSAEPELVFETCGWKSREEPWARGVTSTTASIYLGVIRKVK